MKAEIVHNSKGEPRLLLVFETDEERALFDDGPELAPLVEARGGAREDDGGATDSPLPLLSWSFTIEHSESMTLDRVRVLAERAGIPGPDVEEHDEDYHGPCFCRECLRELSR